MGYEEIILFGLILALIFPIGPALLLIWANYKINKAKFIPFFWGSVVALINFVPLLIEIAPFKNLNRLNIGTALIILNPEIAFFGWILPFEPILIAIATIKWFAMGFFLALLVRKLSLKKQSVFFIIFISLIGLLMLESRYSWLQQIQNKSNRLDIIRHGDLKEMVIKEYSEKNIESENLKHVLIQFEPSPYYVYTSEVWSAESPTYKPGQKISVYQKMIKERDGRYFPKGVTVHCIKTYREYLKA